MTSKQLDAKIEENTIGHIAGLYLSGWTETELRGKEGDTHETLVGLHPGETGRYPVDLTSALIEAGIKQGREIEMLGTIRQEKL